jgi:hypothetical protein
LLGVGALSVYPLGKYPKLAFDSGSFYGEW